MSETTSNRLYITKRCRDCAADMPIGAQKCPRCNRKVGDIDKLGYAKRPVNWLSYIVAATCITGLIWYLTWLLKRFE